MMATGGFGQGHLDALIGLTKTDQVGVSSQHELKARIKELENLKTASAKKMAKELTKIWQENEKTNKAYFLREEAKTLRKKAAMAVDSEQKSILQISAMRLEKEADFQDKVSKLKKAASSKFWAQEKNKQEQWLKAGVVIAGKMFKALGSGLNQFLDKSNQHYSLFSTRLQGSRRSSDSINRAVNEAVGGSQATTQIAVLDNVASLVKSGIAHNVELRATLMTLRDKIDDTFNVDAEWLTRMVRIQQQDSTAARMGYSVELRNLLNSNFQDTSYMNSMRDQVSSALLEATSIMSAAQGAQFENVVQRWLGSMYSAGVSGSTISGLAGGIGDLGSGNIAGIQGPMMNMLVAGSRNAGLSIGGMANQGISANDANRLMQGIYNQIVTVAQSGNNVAMQQMAQQFGLAMSDLRAMANISPNNFNAISSSGMSYDSAITRLNQELGAVNNRTHIKERVENAFTNAMAGVAGGIAGNAGLYTSWLVAELITKSGGLGGGSVFGFSIPDVDKVAKAGIALAGIMRNKGGVLSSLNVMKSIQTGNFTDDQFGTRGVGMIAPGQGGLSVTRSQAMLIGSSDDEAIYDSNRMEIRKNMINADETEHRQKVADQVNQMLLGTGEGGIYQLVASLKDRVDDIYNKLPAVSL